MVDAHLIPTPYRWWAHWIRWVIIFQGLCLQMLSSSLTFSWTLSDKQSWDFVSPSSVWVKWWRGVVWDQVYSKDVEKSGLFFSGIFCSISGVPGWILVFCWEDAQVKFIPVSRIGGLSWLLQVIILLPAWSSVPSLATIWTLLNVAQCGGFSLTLILRKNRSSYSYYL